MSDTLNTPTRREPAVPRLRDVRRLLAYPPAFLMALTVVALLLAMGTARADPPPPATASPVELAVHELADGPWAQAVEHLPRRGTLIVTEVWGLEEQTPEVWRQAYEGPFDELTWTTELRPLIDLIGATPGAALSCDDDGVCLEEGDGYRLRLELGVQNGVLELFAIDVVHDATLGC